ncbi:MAG: ComF family protein [Taibaiella sp.]|nr:ComF family protein [Taibaiella sp.]
MRKLGDGLSHLFYPALCEGCNKPLVNKEVVLCLGCEALLPETGYHHIAANETEQRFAGRIPFKHASSFAYFTDEGLLQHLMHGLKYRGRAETGSYLGGLLGQRLSAAGWIKDIDLIIPVPLHPAREAERGYNQSLLIAEGIGGQVVKPVLDKTLLRARKTESQTQKSRTERVNNMKDAFKVQGAEGLKGKHILLCDDVLTTGATLEACALALLAEESIKISVVTIGIAVS